MKFSKIFSGQASAHSVHIIEIETDISRGLHAFSIVGLPDKGVGEARDRISSAIKNSGFSSPKTNNHKIVISLTPSSIRKVGSSFDMAMALGYLQAVGSIVFNPTEKLFLGELALDGTVRPIVGCLPVIRLAKDKGFREVYVPKDNILEASLIEGVNLIGVSHLLELVNHLQGAQNISQASRQKQIINRDAEKGHVDFADILGHNRAKRCLEIAAVGKHHFILWGEPGAGKSILTKAFVGILPDLSKVQSIELSSLYSRHSIPTNTQSGTPPLRRPHHTSSYSTMLGNAQGKIGEISLAHNGILLLDELPEFDRRVLEGLREPLDQKTITTDSSRLITNPCDFILCATMNPCPCGYHQSSRKKCRCPNQNIRKYVGKISGPLIDRIDMVIKLTAQDIVFEEGKEINKTQTESSEEVRRRIAAALTFAEKRLLKPSSDELIEQKARIALSQATQKYALSYRAYKKIISIARSIADLDQSESIKLPHVSEAIDYHQTDRW